MFTNEINLIYVTCELSAVRERKHTPAGPSRSEKERRHANQFALGLKRCFLCPFRRLALEQLIESTRTNLPFYSIAEFQNGQTFSKWTMLPLEFRCAAQRSAHAERHRYVDSMLLSHIHISWIFPDNRTELSRANAFRATKTSTRAKQKETKRIQMKWATCRRRGKANRPSETKGKQREEAKKCSERRK